MGEMGPGVLNPTVGNPVPLSLSGRLCLAENGVGGWGSKREGGGCGACSGSQGQL